MSEATKAYYDRIREEWTEERLGRILDDPKVLARCIQVRITEKSITQGLGCGRTAANQVLYAVLENKDRLTGLYTVSLNLAPSGEETLGEDGKRVRVDLSIEVG